MKKTQTAKLIIVQVVNANRKHLMVKNSSTVIATFTWANDNRRQDSIILSRCVHRSDHTPYVFTESVDPFNAARWAHAYGKLRAKEVIIFKPAFEWEKHKTYSSIASEPDPQ